MDFLFYYRDILFEIANYLSPNDIKNLKFAFDNLDLKITFLHRKTEIEDFKAENKISLNFSFSPYYIAKLIFKSKINRFIFYNRTYDAKNRILSMDIDYRAFDLRLGGWLTEGDYVEFIEPIIVWQEQLIIKINNGEQWYDQTQGNKFITPSHFHYLLTNFKLREFVDRNIEKLSIIETYISKIIKEDLEYNQLILEINDMFFICYYLPKENRQILLLRLKESLLADNWIDQKQTINQMISLIDVKLIE